MHWAGRDGIQNPGKGLTSGSRAERCQLHCIKIKGGGNESRNKPFIGLAVESLGGFHRGKRGGGGRNSFLFFETQKSINPLKNARGGGGYPTHSELGSTTPGEDHIRMLSQNCGPERARYCALCIQNSNSTQLLLSPCGTPRVLCQVIYMHYHI